MNPHLVEAQISRLQQLTVRFKESAREIITRYNQSVGKLNAKNRTGKWSSSYEMSRLKEYIVELAKDMEIMKQEIKKAQALNNDSDEDQKAIADALQKAKKFTTKKCQQIIAQLQEATVKKEFAQIANQWVKIADPELKIRKRKRERKKKKKTK